MPSARFREIARRLAELERTGAMLAERVEAAKEAVRSTGPEEATPGSGDELRLLQERVRNAERDLNRLRQARGQQTGRLERDERLLASCTRSLEALSLQDDSSIAPVGGGTAAVASPEVVHLTTQAPAPDDGASAEEAAARERVQSLERDAHASRD
ncbi:MAG TPA: hypothetical protein VFP68_23975, partial [Burkholderiaceae bacterium]|nr:hypothetical protein [Burkholderiaceae bacterium]